MYGKSGEARKGAKQSGNNVRVYQSFHLYEMFKLNLELSDWFWLSIQHWDSFWICFTSSWCVTGADAANCTRWGRCFGLHLRCLPLTSFEVKCFGFLLSFHVDVFPSGIRRCWSSWVSTFSEEQYCSTDTFLKYWLKSPSFSQTLIILWKFSGVTAAFIASTISSFRSLIKVDLQDHSSSVARLKGVRQCMCFNTARLL